MKQPKVTEKRFEIGFHILSQWLQLRQNGILLNTYFEDNQIQSVAIYGMGALGQRLYKELQDSKIPIAYAIDRIAGLKNIQGLKVYDSEETVYPEADAIIVTPVQDFWSIVELLESRTDAAIVSLADIVEYCLAGG